jgi:thioredoxin 1
MIQHLDKQNFDTTLKNNSVVLVDFYADWCGPCKALHPALESMAKKFDGQAVISKINVDNNPELSAQFKVRSIPALFYFKDGKLVGQQVGMQSEKELNDNLLHLISN